MTRCPHCEAGWPVKRWQRYDGTGSWRMHQRGSVTFDNFESHYCKKNGWLRRHRLLTAFIALYVLVAAIWVSAAFADTPRLPAGVTCETVRSLVAEHGKVYAYAWARLNGYSRSEIREAEKCLK